MSTSVYAFRCGQCGQIHYLDEQGFGHWTFHSYDSHMRNHGTARLVKRADGMMDIEHVPHVIKYVDRKFGKCWKCGAKISIRNSVGFGSCLRWNARGYNNAKQIVCRHCGRIHLVLNEDFLPNRSMRCPWCFGFTGRKNWLDVCVQISMTMPGDRKAGFPNSVRFHTKCKDCGNVDVTPVYRWHCTKCGGNVQQADEYLPITI